MCISGYRGMPLHPTTKSKNSLNEMLATIAKKKREMDVSDGQRT
jgi:hypothetical protein